MEQMHCGIGEIDLFRFPVSSLLAIVLQQTFAHVTTAELLCHVQNFVAIGVFERQENVLNFDLTWL